MNNYKLLTPGPLTTSPTVKNEMLFDRCTWDDEYKSITQKIRQQLLKLGKVSKNTYTCVLMQGSGTFTVESVLTSAISKDDKLLIVTNGAYGDRMVSMAGYLGIQYTVYKTAFDEAPNINEIRTLFEKDTAITHIAVVHCETTTGILNPIEEITAIAKGYDKTVIIDAMSSFGGMEINIEDLGIDYLISSANKCIQGVPGFGFVIARLNQLQACEGNARSLSLDLFAQWKEMHKDGKWRFTSPTHVVAAFSKAIDELIAEGGISARSNRYRKNNELLRSKLKKIGFETYICEENQSPIITSFIYPYEGFDFNHFYNDVKASGFVIYPGKLTDADTFRIGNIGEVYEDDIKKLCSVIEDYMEVAVV